MKFNSEKKRVIALTLLTIMVSEVFAPPFLSRALAQGTPVSAGLSQYVDLFTGDFNYPISLMSVPGPNGENVPISVSYSAGIKTEQEASWVGLGWNTSFGEISRKVNGVPDDWKNITGSSTVLPDVGSNDPYTLLPDIYVFTRNNGTEWKKSEVSKYYGPLYFKDMNVVHMTPPNGPAERDSSGEETMDVYRSVRMMNNQATFEFPDYDEYFVSGPGMGGKMTPYLASYTYLYTRSSFGNPIKCMHPDKPQPGYKKMQFVMEGSGDFEVKPSFAPTVDAMRNAGDVGNRIITQPNDVTATSSSGKGYIPATNRIQQGTYIKYFTNAEVNTLLTSQNFFIDCALPGTLRPDRSSSDAVKEAIGAFQVTTESGLTYHYSLPVYQYDQEISQFELTEDFKPNYNANTFYEKIKKPQKYVSSWKLTAVTGTDYKDLNGNHQVDAADIGYWVKYNYGCFSNSYENVYPMYGYNEDLTSRYQSRYSGHFAYFYRKGNATPYFRLGSTLQETEELYYINSIETATHVAYFFKDIRIDGHSAPRKANPNQFTPKLYLRRVVLVKKNDPAAPAVNISATTSSTYPLSYANFQKSQVLLYNDYQNIQTALDAVTLKGFQFDYDYSLCPGAYSNGNNSIVFQAKHYNNQTDQPKLFNEVTVKVNAQQNSGKLTLLQITGFEKGSAVLFSPYKFQYLSGALNPNFTAENFDFWGFYKKDFNPDTRDRYTTPDNSNANRSGSFNYTMAWSLEKITTPSLAEITISYESDEYSKVGYSGESKTDATISKPQRIFSMNSFDGSTEKFVTKGLEGNRIYDGINILVNRSTGFNSSDLGNYINNPSAVYNPQEISINIPYRCDNVFTECYTDICDPADFPNPNRYRSKYIKSVNTNPGGVTQYAIVSPTQVNATNVTFSRNYCQAEVIDPIKLSVKAGYLRLSLNNAHGGGIRVAAITMNDAKTAQSYKTVFKYEDGYSTVEPARYIEPDGYFLRPSNHNGERHAVGPNVGYSTVTVIESGNTTAPPSVKLPYTKYKFVNYIEPYVMFYTARKWNGLGPVMHEAFNTVKKIDNAYGKIADIECYDKEDNMVYKKSYSYIPKSSLTEGFVDVKLNRFTAYNNPTNIKANYTYNLKNRFLSSVISEEREYKDGVLTTTKHLEYDPLTLQPTRSVICDMAGGSREISQSPAYLTYADLGTKALDENNTNQPGIILSESVKTGGVDRDAYGELSPQNLNFTTATNASWSKTATHFRQMTAGMLSNRSATANDIVRLPEYNSIYNGKSAADWDKLSFTTLYDARYKRVLESCGPLQNGHYAAQKYGYNNLYPVATAVNSNYFSFTHCSFEDVETEDGQSFMSGEVFGTQYAREQLTILSPAPHSGKKMCVLAPATAKGPSYKVNVNNEQTPDGIIARGIQTGKTYTASVWVNTLSPAAATLNVTVGGSLVKSVAFSSIAAQARYAAGWTPMSLTFDLPDNLGNGTAVEIYLSNTGNTSAYFDDLRIQPVDAQVKAFVRDPATGWVLEELDNDNYLSRYTLDAAGRVTETFQELSTGLKRRSATTYNSAR